MTNTSVTPTCRQRATMSARCARSRTCWADRCGATVYPWPMSFTVRSMVASCPLAGDAVTVSRTSLGTQDRTDSSVFLNGMTSKPMVSKALFNEARTPGFRTVMGRITGCLLSVRRNGTVQIGARQIGALQMGTRQIGTQQSHTHRDRRHLPGGQRYGG